MAPLGLVGPRGRNALAGILSVAFGIGFLFGVYDVVWSLFMRSIGASDWQVGASFSLFALPLVITAPAAGWAADRWDSRWLAVGSAAVSAPMAPIYPWLGSISLVISLGVMEGAAAAFAEPAMNAFLMNAVRAAGRGRAQGALGTSHSLAAAAGAALGGVLFSVGVAVPFVAGAAVSLVFIFAGIPFLWAAGVPARVPAVATIGR